MGLLTFDPRRTIGGLLGRQAMGNRETEGFDKPVPPLPDALRLPPPNAPTVLPSVPFHRAGTKAARHLLPRIVSALRLASERNDSLRTMGLPPFTQLRERRNREREAGSPQPTMRRQPESNAAPRRQAAPQEPVPPPFPPNVDWEFIIGREDNRTEGYVPDIGKSGVTIAAGLDLGQHAAADLLRMGIPERLVRKFQPYLGLKRDKAKKVASNLRISPREADEINRWAFDHFYNSTAAKYDAAVTDGSRFKELPQEAQTAILDLAYQYGENFEREAPKYWGHVTAGDWEGAYGELIDFQDAHSPRRELEAALLRKAIDSGLLKGVDEDR